MLIPPSQLHPVPMRLRCRSFLQVVASQGPKTLEFVKVWGWSWGSGANQFCIRMILEALCTLNIILRYPSIPSCVDISVPAWHETCHPAWSSVRTPCVSQATGGIWVAKKEQAEKLNTRKRWRAHIVWICLGVPPKKILYFEWSHPDTYLS